MQKIRLPHGKATEGEAENSYKQHLRLRCPWMRKTEQTQRPQDPCPAATRTHLRVANRVDDKSKRRPCIPSLCRCYPVPTQSPSNLRASQPAPALREPHPQRKPHPKRSARELLAGRAGSRLISARPHNPCRYWERNSLRHSWHCRSPLVRSCLLHRPTSRPNRCRTASPGTTTHRRETATTQSEDRHKQD